MKLSLIVAMDDRGVIGREGGLPWRLSADLRNFKNVTMGKPLLMGRRTHESIGRPLPGRENIIISRDPSYRAEGCRNFRSLEEALEHCTDVDEVMVVGGAEVYRQALDRASRIYLTEVHASVDGDVYFPVLDRGQWSEMERRDFTADENNEYDYSFVILDRKREVG